jgi:peptide/nickel transport system substrate-binding protein
MDWAEQTGEDGAELEIVLSRRDLMQRGAAITGGLGLLPAILAACGGSKSGSATAGSPATVAKGGGKEVDQITWAMPSDIASFDYAFSYDFSTGVVVPCVVEPLLRFSADGKMHPNLAESWSQPNATTFIYKLR